MIPEASRPYAMHDRAWWTSDSLDIWASLMERQLSFERIETENRARKIRMAEGART